MKKFDEFIISIGKALWKIICFVLQIMMYVIIWKISYWGIIELSKHPYGIVFTYNIRTDIEHKIPPTIFENIVQIMPYECTSMECFGIILASCAVILAFTCIHLPRIFAKLNRKRIVDSKTIPMLSIGIEAMIVPIIYYINLNKEFSWWIIKDFIIVFLTLGFFNMGNNFNSVDYGWQKYLIINLLIALSFGIMASFFLYPLLEVFVLIMLILGILNFWIPIFG